MPAIVAVVANPVYISLLVVKRILVRAVVAGILQTVETSNDWEFPATTIPSHLPFAGLVLRKRIHFRGPFPSRTLLIPQRGVIFVGSEFRNFFLGFVPLADVISFRFTHHRGIANPGMNRLRKITESIQSQFIVNASTFTLYPAFVEITLQARYASRHTCIVLNSGSRATVLVPILVHIAKCVRVIFVIRVIVPATQQGRAFDLVGRIYFDVRWRLYLESLRYTC